MKLVTFSREGQFVPGILADDQVLDLSAGATSVLHLVGTLAGRPALADLISQAPRVPLKSVPLVAPIPTPVRNIFCIGKNYVAHAREFQQSGFDATSAGQEKPALPIVFTKAPTSVIGPNAAIPAYLDSTASVDYEGELAVIIGRGGRAISRNAAMQHVFGYTIINDVTSRSLQKAHAQWFLGKSIDGFCPMGPVLVTADEIPDPTELRLTTRVNGEVRQNASVADLIFDIPTLIETISRRITLVPGDIIATGTPEGVGIGFTPPRYLKSDDTVEVTIEPIGTLSNSVI